jgi:PPOX class probable FMN-dependent enzyme
MERNVYQGSPPERGQTQLCTKKGRCEMGTNDHLVTAMAQLEALYGEKLPASVIKEIDRINDGYRRLIEAAPFVVVATSGPEGLDCSPKGDAPGFVRILDDRTLAIPDRPGNNRIDGFRNIVRDPRVALLFLIPGVGETLRVNGRAAISLDPELMKASKLTGGCPAACSSFMSKASISTAPRRSCARSFGTRRRKSTARAYPRLARSSPS